MFFIKSISSDAQILSDTAATRLIREEVDLIYNFNFDEARALQKKIVLSYPVHPVISLLRGITLYWEKYPLLPTDPAHKLFEDDLRKCIKLSEENDNPDYEAEYLLADLCARGMLLMFYSDNDLTKDVIPLTISTYKYVRKSFDFASSYADLNYFTGLYDYYREAYPREYPVYRSLALLFPAGGMEKGLKELQRAASYATLLSPESYYLLTWIYLNFENNYLTGLTYTSSLYNLYPENALYRATYIKNLFLLKEYDEAENIINSSSATTGNRYFRAQLFIFNGLLQEKKYNNSDLAMEYYSSGISEIEFAGDYGNEYAAYAYFGLSRLCETKREKHAKKIYREKALKLAEFRKITFDK